MTISSIRNRLEKLEGEEGAGTIFLWQHQAETEDQAKARWRAERPPDANDRTERKFIFVRWEESQ